MKYKLTKEQLDRITGGLSDGKTVEDIAKKHGVSVEEINSQLEKGIKVEMEHTDDKNLAREIALDHLYELENYYTKLSKIEENILDIRSKPKEQEIDIKKYLNNSYKRIPENIFVNLPDDLKLDYIKYKVKNYYDLSNNEFNLLSDKLKLKYIKMVIDKKGYLTDKEEQKWYNKYKLKNKIEEKTDYSKEKKSGLHGWFSRRGGEGSKGWIDCNTCRKDSEGKTKCKPCGREKGEERSKYPACRPTPSACKTKGKGEKWGKKSESIEESFWEIDQVESKVKQINWDDVDFFNTLVNINKRYNNEESLLLLKQLNTAGGKSILKRTGELQNFISKYPNEIIYFNLNENSIKVSTEDLKDQKTSDAVKDLIKKKVPVELTEDLSTVDSKGELNFNPTEFTIKDVSTAMDIVEEYEKFVHTSKPKNAVTWYDDKLINKIINYGVKMGWLFRPSVTQVEWTDKGIETLNKDNGELVEGKKDRCYNIAKRKYDKNSAYRSGSIVRCRKGEIWKNESKEELKNQIKEMVEKELKPTITKGDFIGLVLENENSFYALFSKIRNINDFNDIIKKDDLLKNYVNLITNRGNNYILKIKQSFNDFDNLLKYRIENKLGLRFNKITDYNVLD